MATAVVPELRRVQHNVSIAATDLEFLYRTHQSWRLAGLPTIIQRLTSVTGALSELVSDLQNIPSVPQRRRRTEEEAHDADPNQEADAARGI